MKPLSPKLVLKEQQLSEEQLDGHFLNLVSRGYPTDASARFRKLEKWKKFFITANKPPFNTLLMAESFQPCLHSKNILDSTSIKASNFLFL